jgi:hypothetical protein
MPDGWINMPSDPRVRKVMADLAQTLATPTEAGDALEALTRAARDTIPGADYASISVVHDDGTLETIAPTDPLITLADQTQYELRQGPCFDAATQDDMFVAEDLANDARWPEYGPKAAALGLSAQMGVNLHRPGNGRAALNVYARRTWLFVDAYEIADLFASQASLVLGFAHTVDHLNTALESRKAIGQAVGIVMERYAIDEDRAFDFLVRTSRDSNVKLRDIAADIVNGANRRNRLSGAAQPQDHAEVT